jgi:hypothetical protein
MHDGIILDIIAHDETIILDDVCVHETCNKHKNTFGILVFSKA